MFVMFGEGADGVADPLARHAIAVELRAHRLERPLVGLGPVDLAALGVELAPVLGHDADADQIDAAGALNELGVEPVLHEPHLSSRAEAEAIPG